MKTDLYTKIILTIIAIFLAADFLKSSSSPAMANNVKYATVPLNADGSINVKISQTDILDVRLRGIDESPSLNWEPIKVKVEQ